MKKIITLTAIALVIFSCKKENSPGWSNIKVSLTNYITGEPITDAHFVVSESNKNVLSGATILNESDVLDGTHEFGFKPRKSPTWSSSCIISTPLGKYYWRGETEGASQVSFEVERGEDYNLNYELVEYGNWVFELSNTNCENDNDRITLQIESEHSSLLTSSSYSFEEDATGCLANAQLFERKVPAGEYTINYTVQRNSGTSSGVQKFVVEQGGTSTFNLEY
jgi:hypothetical protein